MEMPVRKFQNSVGQIFGIVYILALLTPAHSFSAEFPEVRTSVSFDREKNVVTGTSMISPHAEGETIIHVGSLKVLSLKLDGILIEPEVKGENLAVKTGRDSVLEIHYQCSSGQNGPCVMNERGMFFSGAWYPSPKGLAYHRLSALLPRDFVAVSEAEEVTVEEGSDGRIFSFHFPHPVDAIRFFAGRFAVKKETFNGVDVYAYFFPEDAGLADTYLEYTKKYLRLYENILGKFPYQRFSVVENSLPTAYSVPTLTLLGQDVVRLPFIVQTSLGHEVLHQWFGNSVYVDHEKGNWSEGLTTYLSDHWYEEEEGRGWQYRKQILIEYEAAAGKDKEFALKDFKSRTDPASRAIGYGKSAMVFHMLRRLVGDEVFLESLKKFVTEKRFREATWEDIKTSFEKGSGTDLGRFFDFWVNQKGLPQLEIRNLSINPKGLQYRVSFETVQQEPLSLFDVRASIRTDLGETHQTLKIREKRQGFEIIVDGTPEKLVIDEAYDIFRMLTKEETPPTIAKLLAEEKGLLILPDASSDLAPYGAVVDFFQGRHYVSKKPREVKDEDLRSSSVVVLGAGNPVLHRLFGALGRNQSGLAITLRWNPMNVSSVIAIIDTDSDEEGRSSMGKVAHYGKYSMIAFRDGKSVEKKSDESQRGWIIPLREPVIAFEVPRALSLNQIIDRVSQKKIVYVGEQHDRYEHHVAQVEVIMGLLKKNRRLAIGMEMFQRSSQQALDDYIGGKIEEREFLKASEYFKQWGLDYHYYEDILRLARDEKIPVIGLNIRREVVNKVARTGMDSLTEEERRDLPEGMDMTDETYKERLKEVFEKHAGAEGKNFENFYQSQIIWDEIMSQTIDEFLKKNPDHRIVVIAGGGHFAFTSGIPKRTFRRNGLDYAVLLNDDSVESGIADFILFPKPATIVPAPKLMAILKEEEGRVKIVGFPEKSVSEKAGLKVDDIILSLDDMAVRGVPDIQIFLFYKKRGDRVKVKVLRKRFLMGDSERDVEVTL